MCVFFWKTERAQHITQGLLYKYKHVQADKTNKRIPARLARLTPVRYYHIRDESTVQTGPNSQCMGVVVVVKCIVWAAGGVGRGNSHAKVMQIAKNANDH